MSKNERVLIADMLAEQTKFIASMMTIFGTESKVQRKESMDTLKESHKALNKALQEFRDL